MAEKLAAYFSTSYPPILISSKEKTDKNMDG